MTLRASGHRARGSLRRSALAASQSMSPWHPCARKSRNSARAADATSACAKPTASKPSASARSRIAAFKSEGGEIALRLLSLEVANEILQPALLDRLAQAGHELLVVMQIVP